MSDDFDPFDDNDMTPDEQDALDAELAAVKGSPELRSAFRQMIAADREAKAAAARTAHMPDPHVESRRVFDEAIATGKTADVAQARAIDVMFRAAAAGDERATWTPEKHLARHLADG